MSIVIFRYYSKSYIAIPSYTVRKEIKCSGESEILHELVRDTTRTTVVHAFLNFV